VDNSYTGKTTISGGTLMLEGAGGISESAEVANYGVFDISNHTGAAQIRTLSGNGDTLLGVNDLVITAGGSNGSGSGSYSGVISGQGGLTISGGTEILSGANTWAGNTVVSSWAVLQAGATGTFSPVSDYRVDSDGVLYLDGFSQRVNSLSNAGAVVLSGSPVSTMLTTASYGGYGGLMPMQVMQAALSSTFVPTTLTVTGPGYYGDGGLVSMRTVLGGDGSATDQLIINGDSTGNSRLVVKNADGAGDQTDEGIRVIRVDGDSSGTFRLALPVQAGAYEYVLEQGGVSTPDDGDWYLRSTYIDRPHPPEPIFRAGIANYVAGQSANMEQGMAQLTSLHQRIGGNYDLAAGDVLAWGRLYGGSQRGNGSDRFNYSQEFFGLQLGHDISVQGDGEGNSRRVGISVDYARGHDSFQDDLRPGAGLSRRTGTLSSSSFGLGGYYTLARSNSGYLDVVGIASLLHNRFNDAYGGRSEQNAWRGALSVEAGRTMGALGAWQFEPQAQLSYMHTSYKGFDDYVSRVSGYNTDALRGRAGVRIFNGLQGSARPGEVYGIVNVGHDFLKPEKLRIGETYVREEYDRTYGELGVGGRVSFGRDSTFFGDARYRRSFSGHSEGASLNLGVQVKF
jgi:outer membrane autotransporter protein